MVDALTGKLLVAGPRLIDPNFFRTVVLVCEHGHEGTLGLVLNRPSDIAVGDHLPGWVERLARPEVVFAGGPVQPGTAIGLGRRGPAEPAGWAPVFADVGMVDLTGAPGDVVGDLVELRVFAGYSGWGEGQLADELASGDWVVADADPGDAFGADPETLWTTILRRRGGPPALYAHFPLDPRAN